MWCRCCVVCVCVWKCVRECVWENACVYMKRQVKMMTSLALVLWCHTLTPCKVKPGPRRQRNCVHENIRCADHVGSSGSGWCPRRNVVASHLLTCGDPGEEVLLFPFMPKTSSTTTNNINSSFEVSVLILYEDPLGFSHCEKHFSFCVYFCAVFFHNKSLRNRTTAVCCNFASWQHLLCE